MLEFNEFKITQKHYDLIVKQGFDNMPYETGGFLGGKDGLISAVLPTFNKDWDENKDVFALHNEDISRAHAFFSKHGLSYYGIYHTHPQGGIADPSNQDLIMSRQLSQKYFFIIAYHNEQFCAFKAFSLIHNQLTNIALKVIKNSGYSSIDINDKKKTQANHKQKLNINTEEELNDKLNNLIEFKPIKYDRLPPKEGKTDSDFSTLA